MSDSSTRSRYQDSQRLLTTLLGDYWFWRTEPLPSRVLVDLLAEFGLAEPAARAAIRRLAARDLVVVSKVGRTTYYGVPPKTDELAAARLQKIFRFGSGDRSWDGRWTFVMFSVPEDQREMRRILRTRLRTLGLGLLYDGVWVSPWDLTHDALSVLSEVNADRATVTRARLADGNSASGHPVAAWSLREIADEYESFADDTSRLRSRVLQGRTSPAEALVTRTKVMARWKSFAEIDPDLPLEVLPHQWPREKARRCFIEIYDHLGPLAESRMREIVERHSPELAEFAVHRTSTDLWRGARILEPSAE
ncbi:PaaX family transcriptional regulator C-terminal domain-containing protein [Rhodococcus jostii]|uniref:Transcriptional regulator, PaaX family n=1 Tax=Rhodococcus jostii TaxID=132919 RepID=A0A1H5DL46_RHOJO|nr:PaaX family transcriptional regulator C-terminal domain-containing protein [Rhodococcus jostii]SED79603.1 transcriptional regulator, PaaX family [Rhodococcus jostii]